MKDHLSNTIDGLLIKVILREASEEENRQVEEWIASKDGNRVYFEHFKKIWEDSRNLAVSSTISEEDAWSRFRERVDQAGQGKGAGRGGGGGSAEGRADSKGWGSRGEGKVRYMRVRASWLRIAAAVFVLVAASWFFYEYSYRPSQLLALQSGNTTRTDTLSDGTVVTLNRNSSLNAKKYFEKGSRTVELEGEAFFDVATDKERPFTVVTKEATINVLGTSFNVRTSAQHTEVIVESGLVAVGGKDKRFVDVRPHEKALVSENRDGTRKQVNPDELYNYYRTHEFVCNGTALQRLVEILNEAYNAHIVITEERLNHLPLTTTFQNQSLDEILDIVVKTLNLKMERKDGQILLK